MDFIEVEDAAGRFRDWWLRGYAQVEGMQTPVVVMESADPEPTRRGPEKFRRDIRT